MAATYEELMLKARELKAAGDIESARRVATIALQRKGGAAPSAPRQTTSERVAAENMQRDIQGYLANMPQMSEADMLAQPGMPGPPQLDENKMRRDMMGDVGQGTAAAMAGLQGLTFGAGDELIGGMNALAAPFQGRDMGEAYSSGRDGARTALEVGREQNPLTSLGAELAGAIASPASLIAGPRIAGAATVPGRIATGAVAGAAGGATYGFLDGSGGSGERLVSGAGNMALPAAIGAAAPAIGGAVGRVIDKRRFGNALRGAANDAPNAEELRRLGSQAFREVDSMGTVVDPMRYGGQVQEIMQYLDDAGIDPDLTKKAWKLANRVEASANGAPGSNGIKFSDIEKLRRKAGLAAKGEPADASLAIGVKERIDSFLDNLTDEDIVGGVGEGLSAKVREARALWARMRKSEKLTELIESGASGGYKSGDASGVQQQFANALKNPKLRKQFDDVELETMRRVVTGTGFDFLLRQMGRFGLALNGSGSNAALGGGALFGGAVLGSSLGPVGALAGGALAGVPTAIARHVGNQRIMRAADLAQGVVASGGRRAVRDAGRGRNALAAVAAPNYLSLSGAPIGSQ